MAILRRFSSPHAHALLVAGALLFAAGQPLIAQGGQTASMSTPVNAKQDRQFVNNTTQDTNFEIESGRLALEKSKSADVRAYAKMVIHDHTALRQMIFAANKATGAKNLGTISMTSDDLAMYRKLQELTGNDFDQAYIKELVKGNEKGLDEAKKEVSSAGVPTVKSLAQRRVELDSKHTEKAKELAKAHGVQ